MSNDICARFGKRLRQARKKRGLSQLKLSERCGITHAHLSKLENGRREPCLFMLETLANGLGLTVGELMRPL
jgi:transcriptional regulator with XRE-family HTH domain